MSTSSSLEPKNASRGEKDFADGMKSKTWRWGRCTGLSRWAQGNHRGPSKREAGKPELERVIGDLIMEKRDWNSVKKR